MNSKKYVLYSSADKVYFSRLLNLIFSVRANSKSIGRIVINDIGLTRLQRIILESMSAVELATIPPFNENWDKCFSWKIYVHAVSKENIYFHLDAGNIVLKDLESVYETISDEGYFFVDQGQTLSDILSKELVMKLVDSSNLSKEVFAAGNIGFDRKNEKVGQALIDSMVLMQEGYNLGYSHSEAVRDVFSVGIFHDVKCFRHDQSVLNTVFYNGFNKLKLHSHDAFAAINNDDSDSYIFNKRAVDYSYIKRNSYFLLLPYCFSIDFIFKAKITYIKFIHLCKVNLGL